jgi:hypothetical protein
VIAEFAILQNIRPHFLANFINALMGLKLELPQSGRLLGFPLPEQLNQRHPLIRLAEFPPGFPVTQKNLKHQAITLIPAAIKTTDKPI